MAELAFLGGVPAVAATPGEAPELRSSDVLAAMQPSFELSALSGSGPIEQLEDAFSQLLGVSHAIGVASGTAALHTALRSCDIGPGDEVVLSAYDWPAAAAAALHLGARPVFADINPLSYTLDPASAEAQITPRTRAMLVTHIFGHPADVGTLREIASRFGLFLIEDCAQALGATIDGRHVGSFGDMACFSFGVGKLVSGGEGGMVVTDRDDLFTKALRFSQHPLRQQRAGLSPDYFGLNYRMHPIAAAIVLDQMPKLSQALGARQSAARRLEGILERTPGFKPVTVADGCVHAFHRYSPSYLVEAWDGIPRNLAIGALAAEGVPISPGPIRQPLHRLISRDPHWRRRSRSSPCPVVEGRIDFEECSLAAVASADPIWDEQVKEAIDKVFRLRRRLLSVMDNQPRSRELDTRQ